MRPSSRDADIREVSDDLDETSAILSAENKAKARQHAENEEGFRRTIDPILKADGERRNAEYNAQLKAAGKTGKEWEKTLPKKFARGGAVKSKGINGIAKKGHTKGKFR